MARYLLCSMGLVVRLVNRSNFTIPNQLSRYYSGDGRVRCGWTEGWGEVIKGLDQGNRKTLVQLKCYFLRRRPSRMAPVAPKPLWHQVGYCKIGNFRSLGRVLAGSEI
jgi:hypothetical protein